MWYQRPLKVVVGILHLPTPQITWFSGTMPLKISPTRFSTCFSAAELQKYISVLNLRMCVESENIESRSENIRCGNITSTPQIAWFSGAAPLKISPTRFSTCLSAAELQKYISILNLRMCVESENIENRSENIRCGNITSTPQIAWFSGAVPLKISPTRFSTCSVLQNCRNTYLSSI